MEKGFLDKVEDNAAVRTWSETTQQEKGDSLANGYLLHIWECRFGAYVKRIYGFTSMFKVSNRQSLLKSCKCANLFEEADEYNGDE
ncbi:hypothetical protein Goshw_002878 [Gossypium schwendimanii]|uniref:Uncharacterized protein n=1 Tax=Gossypium schwendimanii TaxID=34291 RepID=A0A7J9NDK3_GOSSC|nr:hypothetical protein [Gossypium schwendimanii]